MRGALIVLVMTAVVGAAVAHADEAVENSPVEVHGFVDASYWADLNLKEDTFGLDQAEVDLTYAFSARGGLRADLEWLKVGDGWYAAVEQAYLDYALSAIPQVTFTLGRFNAPMGFELLDPPDMFQFSHSLVFDYGIPSNLTGFMVAGTPVDRLDARAWLVNGWDDNDLDGAGPLTLGGRIGWSFGELGGVGLSGISGPEEPGEAAQPRRSVVDLDLTLTPVSSLVIGGEANHAVVKGNGTDADWTAFLIMSHVDLNSWAGLTGRFDWFDDPDGIAFSDGIGQTRTAVTLAPTFVLQAGLGALVEFRLDQSTEDVFMNSDGEAKGSATTVAFEMTGSF